LDSGIIGAIVTAGVAALGFIGSLAMLFQRQKDDRVRIGEIEFDVEKKLADVDNEIARMREESREDFRAYQKMFCEQISELKAMMMSSEKRRDDARKEISTFRETLVQRLARMEARMGGAEN